LVSIGYVLQYITNSTTFSTVLFFYLLGNWHSSEN
jgi:hypothetical protein